MALLLPNNPETDVVALAVLKQVIVPNTQLALGSSDGTGLTQVYINNLYALSTGSFPAVHLSSERQVYAPRSRSTYTGMVNLHVDYYDHWDSQSATIDSQYAALSLDLERMKANVESNDTLAFQGTNALETVIKIALSPYSPEIDTKFPGLLLLFRTMTLSCRLPEYDA